MILFIFLLFFFWKLCDFCACSFALFLLLKNTPVISFEGMFPGFIERIHLKSVWIEGLLWSSQNTMANELIMKFEHFFYFFNFFHRLFLVNQYFIIFLFIFVWQNFQKNLRQFCQTFCFHKFQIFTFHKLKIKYIFLWEKQWEQRSLKQC